MEVLSSRIAIRFAPGLHQLPREAWTLSLIEIEVPVEGIKEDLTALTTLDGKHDFPVSNSLSVRTRETNWGASGSFGEFILDLSNEALGGASGVGIVAGIGYLVAKVKGRIRDTFPSQPIDRAQAAELVRTHIELHYAEPSAVLTEVASSTALDTGIHEFTFKSPSGREYGGTAGEIAGAPTCTKVWCRSET
ncbi:hypothetical protein [Streptomyces bambusae]|uniref:Uncharacterized protein n=1 Tax=Streptomyces bambusae TaxID=1550616 RepID=A0ABS6Z0E7_9ACTN|nr:hypothetical protein [Streptomyces bambusae]MBW5481177.1 hypothetical protein [Streptomyces bambusae]